MKKNEFNTAKVDLKKYRVKPSIGMRTLKTAFAATVCAMIYFFWERNPTFACIGAIFGVGSNLENSVMNGGNRAIGTTIGGLIGMLMYRIYLIFYPYGGFHFLLVPLCFFGVILLIVRCQRYWVGGIQPGGVVLCILLFNTPAATYVSYALNRIFDTYIGVFVAMIVNVSLPGGFDSRGNDIVLNAGTDSVSDSAVQDEEEA